MIEVMDEKGLLHAIREIQLLISEEKTYFSIRTVEHLCRINLGGRMETVKLVFTKEICKWVLVVLW